MVAKNGFGDRMAELNEYSRKAGQFLRTCMQDGCVRIGTSFLAYVVEVIEKLHLMDRLLLMLRKFRIHMILGKDMLTTLHSGNQLRKMPYYDIPGTAKDAVIDEMPNVDQPCTKNFTQVFPMVDMDTFSCGFAQCMDTLTDFTWQLEERAGKTHFHHYTNLHQRHHRMYFMTLLVVWVSTPSTENLASFSTHVSGMTCSMPLDDWFLFIRCLFYNPNRLYTLAIDWFLFISYLFYNPNEKIIPTKFQSNWMNSSQVIACWVVKSLP